MRCVMIRVAIFKILSGWRSGVSFRWTGRPSVHSIPLDLSTYRALGRIRLALTFLPPVDHIRLVNIFFHNRHYEFRTKQSISCRRDAQSIWRRRLLLQPSKFKGTPSSSFVKRRLLQPFWTLCLFYVPSPED